MNSVHDKGGGAQKIRKFCGLHKSIAPMQNPGEVGWYFPHLEILLVVGEVVELVGEGVDQRNQFCPDGVRRRTRDEWRPYVGLLPEERVHQLHEGRYYVALQPQLFGRRYHEISRQSPELQHEYDLGILSS